MTKQQWKTFDPFFVPAEKWGNPYKMHYVLLWMLHRLRKSIGKPFIIHCGYETEGHTDNSYHAKGMAVDFHVKGVDIKVPGWELNIENWFTVNGYEQGKGAMYQIVDTFNVGIGIYPYWNNPGFHLDIGERRVWWQDKNGEYHYFAQP